MTKTEIKEFKEQHVCLHITDVIKLINEGAEGNYPALSELETLNGEEVRLSDLVVMKGKKAYWVDELFDNLTDESVDLIMDATLGHLTLKTLYHFELMDKEVKFIGEVAKVPYEFDEDFIEGSISVLCKKDDNGNVVELICEALDYESADESVQEYAEFNGFLN